MRSGPSFSRPATHYAVTATVTRRVGRYTSTTQVPTFYLDERVQGIMDDADAERVARTVINPAGLPDLAVNAFVLKLPA